MSEYLKDVCQNITVVIPTSPIKSHPDTRIIDETIKSVRHHLPDAEIIITFDGVHPKYADYTGAYNEYKNIMLWRCLHEYYNVLPMVFDEHVHQSGMMKAAIQEVRTPTILYMEHDAPLTTDRLINWSKCVDMIDTGDANTIRFHFEEVIPEDHVALMIGEAENGMLRTYQWSQRPHLSSKTYYETMLEYFPDGSPTFIEDEWHGVVSSDYTERGMHGWFKHRLWIYYDVDAYGIKRSYTTDGREGDPKVGEGFAR